MNKAQRRKAHAVLFRNCRGYLRGERRILAPEIIVTQGKEAGDALSSLRGRIIETIDEFASVIKLYDEQVFWLHTYHPNNWGAFNRQRNFDKATNNALGWVRYSGLMHAFMQRRK